MTCWTASPMALAASQVLFWQSSFILTPHSQEAGPSRAPVQVAGQDLHLNQTPGSGERFPSAGLSVRFTKADFNFNGTSSLHLGEVQPEKCTCMSGFRSRQQPASPWTRARPGKAQAIIPLSVLVLVEGVCSRLIGTTSPWRGWLCEARWSHIECRKCGHSLNHAVEYLVNPWSPAPWNRALGWKVNSYICRCLTYIWWVIIWIGHQLTTTGFFWTLQIQGQRKGMLNRFICRQSR